jgi:NADPH-dependent curcumin reductase CurA
METSQFVLASRPYGMPAAANFRVEKIKLEELKDNEVLLKSWYISVDPYMRGRMNDTRSYIGAFQIDQPINGGVVAKVINSKSNKIKTGDIVVGMLPWSEFSVENADKLKKIGDINVPPHFYLGLLGMPGLTAYIGMIDICKPAKGETIVVSGAAGAVGLIAGQIAKIQGARVIGIAGSEEKCKLLKEKFGFDEAINYKTSKSIRKDLEKICPEGVNAYFDNVGGEITEGVVANLNFRARIALCGQISQYNNTKPSQGSLVMAWILTKSVTLQGFIVRNFPERFDEVLTNLTKWLKEDKLKYTETIVRGFDKLPDAFLGLFSGINQGKMLVEIE